MSEERKTFKVSFVNVDMNYLIDKQELTDKLEFAIKNKPNEVEQIEKQITQLDLVEKKRKEKADKEDEIRRKEHEKGN